MKEKYISKKENNGFFFYEITHGKYHHNMIKYGEMQDIQGIKRKTKICFVVTKGVWGDWMEWQENEDYGFGEYD